MVFFFSSRRRHTRFDCDWSSDVCSSDLGTGGDPTSSNYKADWDAAIERWTALGEIAAANGLKLYTHNHAEAYSFLLDSRSEERRVGKSVDLGGRGIIKQNIKTVRINFIL